MVATSSRRAGRTPAARRRRSVARLGVFACAFLVACVTCGSATGAFGSDVSAGSARSDNLGLRAHASGRRLLKSEGEGSLYPPDLFTESQLRRGAVFLHAFGVLYTFVAIAIVCDDFFVPALEVLVERYGIDDDVAGATFMAAGGSAPELFTALIGVFIAKSNVGFGTIIGSAVFNVLFVIGACAFFSRETLSLTWWPLARDCAFYVLDLVVLFVFFLDQKIELYESVVLLLLYFCYVFFMKYNQSAERWVKTRVLGQKMSDFDREKVEDAARKAMDREASLAHAEAERLERARTDSSRANRAITRGRTRTATLSRLRPTRPDEAVCARRRAAALAQTSRQLGEGRFVARGRGRATAEPRCFDAGAGGGAGAPRAGRKGDKRGIETVREQSFRGAGAV